MFSNKNPKNSKHVSAIFSCNDILKNSATCHSHDLHFIMHPNECNIRPTHQPDIDINVKIVGFVYQLMSLLLKIDNFHLCVITK